MNRRRSVFIILVVVGVIFMSLDFRDHSGPVGSLQRAADKLFYPIQQVTQAIVAPVSNVWSAFSDVGTLRAQIEQLEADNAKLRTVGVSIADITKQNHDLRGLLHMGIKYNLSLIGAEVASFAPGDLERSVVINAGFTKGIGVGMAVVNNEGIIGVVNQVASDHASVDLLSSSQARLVVRDATTGVRGTLVGQGTGPMALTVVDAGIQIAPGSDIVTQEFTGSVVPGGIPVGQLQRDKETTLDGETQLLVRPYADLRTLHNIAVVIGNKYPEGTFEGVEIIDPNKLPIPDFKSLPSPTQISATVPLGQVGNETIVDANGQPVQPQLVVNEQGQVVNAQGQVMKGFSVNPQGQIVDPQGQVVNVLGQPVNAQGQVLNAQGQPVNAQGQPVQGQAGQAANPQGQPVQGQAGQPAQGQPQADQTGTNR